MPPGKKEEELSFFLVMTTKNCSSLSFYRGPLLSLWTSFELQLKKVNPWVGQKLKFSFCQMNWTLVYILNSRKELNLIGNCKSTFNCNTALRRIANKINVSKNKVNQFRGKLASCGYPNLLKPVKFGPKVLSWRFEK